MPNITKNTSRLALFQPRNHSSMYGETWTSIWIHLAWHMSSLSAGQSNITAGETSVPL